MKNLSNITLREFRAALVALGLACVRTSGGHEAWMKPGMTRPVIFQTHIEPLPEFIVRNAIRNLDLTRQQFIDMLENL